MLSVFPCPTDSSGGSSPTLRAFRVLHNFAPSHLFRGGRIAKGSNSSGSGNAGDDRDEDRFKERKSVLEDARTQSGRRVKGPGIYHRYEWVQMHLRPHNCARSDGGACWVYEEKPDS